MGCYGAGLASILAMEHLLSRPAKPYRSVNVPMKSPSTLLIAIALLVGCAKPPPAASPHRYPDLESAIAALATSEEIQDANAAAAQIYDGGIPAIYALREHLDDHRLIPPGFCTSALNRYDMLTVSDQALWTIQEIRFDPNWVLEFNSP